MSYTVEAAFIADDLNLARIGLDNALVRASTLQSLRVSDDTDNENPLFPVVNVTRKNTYETWRPTSFSPKIVATWASPQTVNYVAVARHNLGSAGITGGSLWVTPVGESIVKVCDFVPTTDKPLLVPFDETEIEAAEVRFGTGASAIIAVVHLGRAVVMERPLRGTMQPVWFSRQTGVLTQTTDGGETLGSLVIRRGSSVAPQWTNLSKDFYNNTLRQLAYDMPSHPFFFQWRPDEHPEEVVYGNITGDAEGSHISGVARYTFGFSMQGAAL